MAEYCLQDDASVKQPHSPSGNELMLQLCIGSNLLCIPHMNDHMQTKRLHFIKFQPKYTLTILFLNYVQRHKKAAGNPEQWNAWGQRQIAAASTVTQPWAVEVSFVTPNLCQCPRLLPQLPHSS